MCAAIMYRIGQKPWGCREGVTQPEKVVRKKLWHIVQCPHNQRLLEEIPMTETERKALTGDQAALEQLANASSLSDDLR